MTGQGGYVRAWVADAVRGWDRFWFTPADGATLSLIRVCAGAMLFYTHLVWSLGLEDFFGLQHGWISPEAVASGQERRFAWSYFYWIESPALLWTVHIAALVVFAMLMLGIFTRVTSVMAYLAAVSYANRVPGALFGLDDTNVMLAMYLMIGASGAYYSFDAWWAKRQGRAGGPKNQTLAPTGRGQGEGPAPSIAANIAVRLLQLHLCIVYLFSGLSKCQGEMWWNGTAIWGAVSNLEYQSLDATWLANHPHFMDFMTHLAVFWEVFYIALVWPRWTRPIALGMAVLVHGGIAIFLGMKTFGLAMIIANMAFLSPNFVRSIFRRRNKSDPADSAVQTSKKLGQGRGVAAQR